MDNFRDLFTEKPNVISAFHKDSLKTCDNVINEGLYDAFYSPVMNIDIDYFNISTLQNI